MARHVSRAAAMNLTSPAEPVTMVKNSQCGGPMQEIIAYKFTEKQVLRYLQVLNMILSDPSHGKMAGRSETRSTLTVQQAHPDGSWTLMVAQEPLKLEGPLLEYVPEDLAHQTGTFRMDSSGSVTFAADQSLPPRIASFPTCAVAEGDSWISESGGIQTQFMVRSLEDRKGELIAHLVSSAQYEVSAGRISTLVESTFAFSISRGCHLQSTTVIEMAFTDGKSLSFVVENTLLPGS